jgi:hypothetical protein
VRGLSKSYHPDQQSFILHMIDITKYLIPLADDVQGELPSNKDKLETSRITE